MRLPNKPDMADLLAFPLVHVPVLADILRTVGGAMFLRIFLLCADLIFSKGRNYANISSACLTSFFMPLFSLTAVSCVIYNPSKFALHWASYISHFHLKLDKKIKFLSHKSKPQRDKIRPIAFPPKPGAGKVGPGYLYVAWR